MGVGRSQRGRLEHQGYDSGGNTVGPPAITGIDPDTATIVGAGVVNRTIATMSITGGSEGTVTYSVVFADGLALNILGNLLRTNANPVGAPGVYNTIIGAEDSAGATVEENIEVTVT